MYAGHFHPQFTEGKTGLTGVSFVCLVSGEKILVISECGKSVNQKVRVGVSLKKQTRVHICFLRNCDHSHPKFSL